MLKKTNEISIKKFKYLPEKGFSLSRKTKSFCLHLELQNIFLLPLKKQQNDSFWFNISYQKRFDHIAKEQ